MTIAITVFKEWSFYIKPSDFFQFVTCHLGFGYFLSLAEIVRNEEMIRDHHWSWLIKWFIWLSVTKLFIAHPQFADFSVSADSSFTYSTVHNLKTSFTFIKMKCYFILSLPAMEKRKIVFEFWKKIKYYNRSIAFFYANDDLRFWQVLTSSFQSKT